MGRRDKCFGNNEDRICFFEIGPEYGVELGAASSILALVPDTCGPGVPCCWLPACPAGTNVHRHPGGSSIADLGVPGPCPSFWKLSGFTGSGFLFI